MRGGQHQPACSVDCVVRHSFLAELHDNFVDPSLARLDRLAKICVGARKRLQLQANRSDNAARARFLVAAEGKSRVARRLSSPPRRAKVSRPRAARSSRASHAIVRRQAVRDRQSLPERETWPTCLGRAGHRPCGFPYSLLSLSSLPSIDVVSVRGQMLIGTRRVTVCAVTAKFTARHAFWADCSGVLRWALSPSVCGPPVARQGMPRTILSPASERMQECRRQMKTTQAGSKSAPCARPL